VKGGYQKEEDDLKSKKQLAQKALGVMLWHPDVTEY